ncbi:MAG TPA: Nramp family divalent metal transporter [Longimicrobiales bacterium]|nr:Nramp family divalent metal transporter [Longimicrobiales bacterium]
MSEAEAVPVPRARSASFLRLAGPGLVMAATGIGSGDVVASTVAGANYGVVLLWALIVGAFFKFVLTEGIARWQLATGTTALEGWAAHLPGWVKHYFGVYLVLWTVAVTAALTNATGLGLSNLTGGAIPVSWGAVLHSLMGCAFVLAGGYASFERLMKTLVGVMGFAILTCALLTFDHPAAAAAGMVVPSVPPGAAMYVLSLIGGIGGSITLLSYNYWMKEEGLEGSEHLSYVRGDVAVAYAFTALFGVSIALIANQAFFVTGTTLTDAAAVSGMAETLGTILGPFGRWAYAIGFWAAVFASLLGVWQSVPYMYADIYGILKRLGPEERERVTRVTSTPYRLALLFVTLVPLPFAFVGRPIAVVVVYTIVGSLFVPFLASTLLYLNNRVPWSRPVPHNGRAVNLLLCVILVVFAVVGAQEMLDSLG